VGYSQVVVAPPEPGDRRGSILTLPHTGHPSLRSDSAPAGPCPEHRDAWRCGIARWERPRPFPTATASSRPCV